jgi:SNF2 family DNA or RNA helicase
MASAAAFTSLCWLAPKTPSPHQGQRAADEAPSTAEPLVLFDPAEHPDDPLLSSYKKVTADMFLADKLRPHQREGVKFAFECLAGLRKPGFFGGVLCDGMGWARQPPLL